MPVRSGVVAIAAGMVLAAAPSAVAQSPPADAGGPGTDWSVLMPASLSAVPGPEGGAYAIAVEATGPTVVWALSGSGDPAWHYVPGRRETPVDLVGTPDGGVAVVLSVPQGVQVLSLSPDGRVRWRSRLFRGPSTSLATAAATGGDGSVVVAANGLTAALDVRGRVRWRHGRLTRLPPYGRALAVGPGGEVLSVVRGDAGVMARVHETTGVVRWARSTGESADLEPAAAVAPDGSVRVTSAEGVTAFDAAGRLLWSAAGSNFRPGASGPDGGIYLTDPDDQHVLRAVGPDGAERWARDIGGSADAVAVAPDGTAFVAFRGFRTTATGVVALGPSGDVRWGVPGDVGALSLAPGSRILITGTSGSIRLRSQEAVSPGAADGPRSPTVRARPPRVRRAAACAEPGGRGRVVRPAAAVTLDVALPGPAPVTVAVTQAGRRLGVLSLGFESGNAGQAYLPIEAPAGVSRLVASGRVERTPGGPARCLAPGSFRLAVRVDGLRRSTPLTILP